MSESIELNINHWERKDRFPNGNGRWQLMRPPFNRVRDGEEHVDKLVSRWHAFDPVLVATPESEKFLPLICIPSLSSRIHRSVLRQQILGLYLLSGLVFLAIASLFILPNKTKAFGLLLLFGLTLIFCAVDFFLVTKHIDRLKQRALFVHWIYENGRKCLPLVLLTIIAGLLQLTIQSSIGGLDPLVRKFGMLYLSVESGEWWRIAVGPFIHSGIMHWMGNLFMLIVGASIVGALTEKRKTFLIEFILINSFCAIAAMTLSGSSRSDAFLGISGGVLGLWGWGVGYAYKHRSRLPAYLWITLLLFGVLNIGLAPLFSVKSSEIAHISGFLLGSFIGLINGSDSRLIENSQQNA